MDLQSDALPPELSDHIHTYVHTYMHAYIRICICHYDKLKLLLNIVTKFSEDIGMSFGLNKCAYVYIERGKRKSMGEKIVINRVETSELEEGKLYNYLGVDEYTGYNGPLNKEKISKEFLCRTRKIWESELFSRNKVTAYNTFALPIVTMSVGALEWSKQEF